MFCRDPAVVGPNTGLWLFALGFFAPWVGVANKAIIAECSPAAVLGSAVALNAAIEGVFSALVGAPLVGWLAEHTFGYRQPEQGVSLEEMEPAMRTANAQALGQALFYMTLVPWVICLVLYTLIHLTYPGDCAKAAAGRRRLTSKART